MKMQPLAIVVTAINFVLMITILAQMRPASAQKKNVSHVLRGRALEIVDSLGKVRASIKIEPPVEIAENCILKL
jgi:hypothetical protein